ncbi:MAG: PGF-CTERM sorting domain-containing protein [Archaeoglobaceae archaeon]|nr:PGF-CTERM sorting domain-containing protein [Archaeoglobaceae archaeon]MDW8118642.1 PGF-CTERM sorting domain-containing protein [Archaeoglobaceae archaeon]
METPTLTKPVVTPTTPVAKPFIPGFELLFAVVGLIAVAYLLRR